MRKLCEGYNYSVGDEDKLRDILGKRCGVDSLSFYSRYEESTGTYTGNINCTKVEDEDMSSFSALLEVDGDFTIEDSNITTVDKLIRLKRVTGTLSIQKNLMLVNIYGLSNVRGEDGHRLIIDDPSQYSVKADEALDFCLTTWDIYIEAEDSRNDMTTVCAP